MSKRNHIFRRLLFIAFITIFVSTTMLSLAAVSETNVDSKIVTLNDQMANPSITYELVNVLSPFGNQYQYYNYASTGSLTWVNSNLYLEVIAGPYGPGTHYTEGVQQGKVYTFEWGASGKKSWIKKTLETTIGFTSTNTSSTVTLQSFDTPADDVPGEYYVWTTHALWHKPYTTYRYAYLQKPTAFVYSPNYPYQRIAVKSYSTTRYAAGDISPLTSYHNQDTYGCMWHRREGS